MESYAYDMIMNDKRSDGRKLDEYRKIVIKKGLIKNAEGSAEVKIGKTKVIVGVKFGIGTPYSDTPNEGTLMVNAEFSPMSSPDFEAGPPRENAVELARVVDRGLRESHCIDLKKLCITPEEQVLSMFVDVHIINNAGNLIDCAFLASIAALMDAKMPKVENDKIVPGQAEDDLEVLHQPVEITVCKIGDKFVVDPTDDEEESVDAKLTIAVREDDMICALQKQHVEGLTVDDVKQMIEIAMKKSKELRKLL